MPLSPLPPGQPPARTAAAWIARALQTGEPSHLPGRLPAYTPLEPAAKAAARKRGSGQVVPQPLTGDVQGGEAKSDPINFVVTGELSVLKAAFTRAGWTQADTHTVASDVKVGLSALFKLGDDTAGPVSTQFLAGHEALVAFNKHSDHNRARDHLRIFALSNDPKTQQPRYAIAATRDVSLSLTVPHTWPSRVEVGHDIDPFIDPERDMVMRDLLATGLVKDWRSVEGQREPGLTRPDPSGCLIADQFKTDGQVYVLELQPR